MRIHTFPGLKNLPGLDDVEGLTVTLCIFLLFIYYSRFGGRNVKFIFWILQQSTRLVRAKC